MADAAGSWYSQFSWSNHILDILLVGWICWAFLVSFLINGVTNFFGPLARAPLFDRAKRAVEGAPQSPSLLTQEKCQWINDALAWFHMNFHQTPEFMNAWVHVLNEQLKKLGGPVSTSVAGIQQGSLPPKFSEVQHEIHHDDFVVHVMVESTDVMLNIFASQHTNDGVKLTNCLMHIQRLRGHMRVKAHKIRGELVIEASFSGRPTINMTIKPDNPFIETTEIVDLSCVEESLRNAIALSTVFYNMSSPHPHRAVATTPHGSSYNQSPHSSGIPATLSTPQEEALFEPIEASQMQSAFQAPTHSKPGMTSPYIPSSPPKPPRYTGDKRLLIKVIKGSGLANNTQGACDPFCAVSMDNPEQVFYTSVANNTVHPFWDDHFLFDITNHSSTISFEVFDKNKAAGEDFLGEAIIDYEDLKKSQSSRQIIPLACPPGINDFVSGTITVEFLSLDPAEADALESSLSSAYRQSGNLQQSGLDQSYNAQQHQIPTIESSQHPDDPSRKPQRTHSDRDNKKSSFADTIRKKFQRKRRARSADRSSSLREGSLLKPPGQSYGPKSKDDMDLVRKQNESPNLKKSRSLGGSLKKLFRRGRKRSRSRGDTSRESSFSRSSTRNVTEGQVPSREPSLPRNQQMAESAS